MSIFNKPILTLEDAKRIAAAAEVEAQKNGWKVVVAVVDDGGHLLYLQRGHETQWGSVETAIMKANAAVAFQRPTKASEDAVLSGRLIHLALPGVIPVEDTKEQSNSIQKYPAVPSKPTNIKALSKHTNPLPYHPVHCNYQQIVGKCVGKRFARKIFTNNWGCAMKLNDITIKKAKPETKPRKLSDGYGLYVLIHPNGGKYWQLAYRFAGKQKTLALGTYPDVTLADARDRRDQARKQLTNGIDPGTLKQTEKRLAKISAANTFEAVAREWVENRANDWTDGHKDLTLNSLEQDAFPALGHRPIAEITPAELLAAMRAIEKRGALEIASRVLQRSGAVFRFAIATDRCKTNPATELRGALKTPKRTHYTTIVKGEFPKLLRDIDGYQGHPLTTYALQLIALTFTRTSELIEAEWKELDLDRAEWLIPAERMKMKRPHLVPLSSQAVAIFREAAKLTGERLHVFPNRNDPSKPASKAVILRALGRMGYTGRMTGHGFRSAASTMLNEHKSKWGIHRDVIEMQLAHVEKNASRAAYNFAEYLDERRAMMQQWADHLDKLKKGAEVIPLRA